MVLLLGCTHDDHSFYNSHESARCQRYLVLDQSDPMIFPSQTVFDTTAHAIFDTNVLEFGRLSEAGTTS